MHPTADTSNVIHLRGVARRVMPALDCWGGLKITTGWMCGRGGWRRRMLEAAPARGGWPDLVRSQRRRHGVARGSSGAGRAAGRALKMTQSNKRMHATRDTLLVIERKRAGGRVMRGVRPLF